MTSGSFIYSNFFDDIMWIKEKLQTDFESLPDELKSLGTYYLKNRLLIIPNQNQEVINDPDLGRPVPYAVFWFSEALGGYNPQSVRKLALAMIYSSIITTIRDDVEDESITSKLTHDKLYEYFATKHIEIFQGFFPRDSDFWKIYQKCEADIRRYTDWRKTPLDAKMVLPYSDDFLWDSSRYFSAVVLPSLAAVGILTDHEENIPIIEEYLRYFSMGWRVYDDLKDWAIDIKYEDLNRSSLLLAISHHTAKREIKETTVQSFLMDEKFVNETFEALLTNFQRALDAASHINSRYLNQFMKEQFNYHNRVKKNLLENRTKLIEELKLILSSRAN
jgi:hypothetical protein